MAGSAEERRIRETVVGYVRVNIPSARVVHELVIGQCRADVAAVERERLTLFEIKSSKDKLTRLERQLEEFRAASHCTIVVADARWFEEFTYTDSESRGFRPSSALAVAGNQDLWRFPRPRPGEFAYDHGWRLPRLSVVQPRAWDFLSLLWKDELLSECRQHRVDAVERTTRGVMIERLAYHLTGREIARAVCRQLRSRPFPAADAPIYDETA